MIDDCHSSDNSLKYAHFKSQFSQLSSAQRKRITNGLSRSSTEEQAEESGQEKQANNALAGPTYMLQVFW